MTSSIWKKLNHILFQDYYNANLWLQFIRACEYDEIKADVLLSHSWSWGWAGPWDCWGRCCQVQAACRAQGAGWGTGCRLYHPGWWTDTVWPAASGPAGCGTWRDYPGGTAPMWERPRQLNTTYDFKPVFWQAYMIACILCIVKEGKDWQSPETANS